jgi:hypothetical protein
MTEKHKNKIRAKMKGIKPKNWESLYTIEINKKRSETAKRIGSGKWLKGKPKSKKHREKISLGVKNSDKFHKAVKGEEFRKAHTGEKCYFWKGGISFEPYSPAWTSELRQSIRQRDNFTCQICGKYPAFACHHIDYNKKNCEPENLIILCNSCHAKTNNNREYWKNYFQQLRTLLLKPKQVKN